MQEFKFSSLSFEGSLRKYLILHRDRPTLRVLDIGGGTGLFWENLLNEFPNIELTICDLFDPGELKDFSHKRISLSFEQALPSINSNDFDLVTAIDLLEHLDTASAYRLLYQMQRISRETIVVYTPNGFVWQPPSTNNPYNAHVSGWTCNNLIQFGFKNILGHVGHKKLIGPYSRPINRSGNPYISYLIEKTGEKLAIAFPGQAFALSGWMNCEDTYSIDQAR
jgi:ubiquinone/menaquinone biosynthesis C-methylase UbiE